MKRLGLALAVPFIAHLFLAACAQTSGIGVTQGTAQRDLVGVSGVDRAAPERLLNIEIQADSSISDREFQADQTAGLQGDAQAALRIADMYERGTGSVPKNEERAVQWLLHASALNNGTASYRLYQYYLSKRLDREAVFFENRALNQGYVLPPRLDARRG